MAISGTISDLKILVALYGNVTIKEIITFKGLRNVSMVA
ncbi:hypothetical protein Desmer_2843 [Desulfosporosinus meridiei DSM 13257]|uniref:Uncharacterized protein n=1 Tax=Desulfosporosinus meridiei (strain ATCC BAA-275 / DSM 13257 / KCTC 12902 / NCIMB 13706 / S10) TaxID=768704 RepID=J7IX59_DESMD|nr:hypothetical protein Desmer_2843 [Desulfosporosinus meridiei DSM 13257]